MELADELNEDLGVTPIQRQAMEIGSMAGWDVPGADPKHYEESYWDRQVVQTLSRNSKMGGFCNVAAKAGPTSPAGVSRVAGKMPLCQF